MQVKKSGEEKLFDPERIKGRIVPEGRILLYSLFLGLALGPALAFVVFLMMGTVPEGYTIIRFYGDVRRDLFSGVCVSWAVVLAPYALVQVGRLTLWALKATKDSISMS